MEPMASGYEADEDADHRGVLRDAAGPLTHSDELGDVVWAGRGASQRHRCGATLSVLGRADEVIE
jgi:hypothetical protein